MINYDIAMKNELSEFAKSGEVPKILLHSCCAPCSSYVLEYLSTMGKITVFYYNPNIIPADEYEKRLAEQKRFIALAHADIGLIEGNYDVSLFKERIKGREAEPEGGERCRRCFELRLRETAKLANNLRMDYFTSTLSISPHKNEEIINDVMKRAYKSAGAKPLLADFKKKNGYKRSIELSKEYGLYRQNYCGCTPSKDKNI